MNITRQTSQQSFKEKVRQFNKRTLNPFTLKFAGRRHSPYTIVQHVGRKSGRVYHTPVVAMAQDDEHFVMPLPYGDHVDWCRNLLEAEGGYLAWQGEAYKVGEPEVIAPEEGLTAFPEWMQELLEGAETGKYLRVKRLSESPEPHAKYEEIIADYPIEDVIRQVVIGTAVLCAVVALLVVIGRKMRGCCKNECSH